MCIKFSLKIVISVGDVPPGISNREEHVPGIPPVATPMIMDNFHSIHYNSRPPMLICASLLQS